MINLSSHSGIGIDDMFVILQCFNNLKESETSGGTLNERIALTMKHAGVAITVTSVTDVLAFGVGAVTVGCQSVTQTGLYLVTCYSSHNEYVFGEFMS
jgi:hypothetical protein